MRLLTLPFRRPFATLVLAVVVFVSVRTSQPYIDPTKPFSFARFLSFLGEAWWRSIAVVLFLTVLRVLFGGFSSGRGSRHLPSRKRPVGRRAPRTTRAYLRNLPPAPRPRGPAGRYARSAWEQREPPTPAEPGARRRPVTRAATGTRRRAPALRNLTVDSAVTSVGVPVEVAWDFDGAESVTVDGRAGLPAAGQTSVYLDSSRSVEVAAHNDVGVTTTRTAVVVLLPVPRIETVRLPPPPVIRLTADVGATLRAGTRTLDALAQLFAEQDARRRPPPAALRPILVPHRLVSWLRPDRRPGGGSGPA